MGQKANPNSFNQANYTVFSNSFFSSKEYAKLFFNNYAVNSVIRALFEKWMFNQKLLYFIRYKKE